MLGFCQKFFDKQGDHCYLGMRLVLRLREHIDFVFHSIYSLNVHYLVLKKSYIYLHNTCCNPDN